jgi:hypothetical protein
VKLKRLDVLAPWELLARHPPGFRFLEGVGLGGEHPLLKWLDGIEGLKNTG